MYSIYPKGFRFLWLLLFLLIYIPTINAQGCCSGGAPLSGNLNLNQVNKGLLLLNVTYDYNQLKDVVFKTDIINDNTRSRITNTSFLRLDYSLNNRLAFGILLPFVEQVEKINANTSNKTKSKGLGDITILSQYDLLRKGNISLSYAIGVKAPSGSTSRKNNTNGLRLHPDLQPGTGAWDWFNIIQSSWQDFLISDLDLIALVNYRRNGKSKRFNQQQQYQFGSEFQSYLALTKEWIIGNYLLNTSLGGRYRHTSTDKTNGFEAVNTGGHWVYVIPGLTMNFNPDFSIGTSVELPVYRNLTGIQLTTSYRFNATILYSFKLLKTKEPFNKVIDLN